MKPVSLIIAVALFILSGCSKDQGDSSSNFKNVPLTESQKTVVQQSNAFGFDFFRKAFQIVDTSKNLMVSPLSISMALGMARNGAAGTTLDSMTQTLRFTGLTDEEINQSYKYILQTFSGLDSKVKVSIANSIWYRNSFSVEPTFLQTNQTYFDATVAALDFNSSASVQVINAWVSDKTNNLIPKILDQIPYETVMYLVNAVYFKGVWRYQFEKEGTMEKPFYLADGSSIQVDAMSQNEDLKVLDKDGFSAIELPYNQGNYNMTVLLPDQGFSLQSIIEQLTQENWNQWNDGFVEANVDLQLPKFKYEYDEKKMIPILSALGMTVAFNSDFANFSRINPNEQLYISDVRHKTFIETNEEGTEAAAVTSIGFNTTSAGPNDPLTFLVNRPFVYLITEKSTGTILFMGTVQNPLQN